MNQIPSRLSESEELLIKRALAPGKVQRPLTEAQAQRIAHRLVASEPSPFDIASAGGLKISAAKIAIAMLVAGASTVWIVSHTAKGPTRSTPAATIATTPVEIPAAQVPAPRVSEPLRVTESISQTVKKPAREDALALEIKLLGRALKQLRGEKDPAAALATLRHPRLAGPNSLLRIEAVAAEVEARLAMHDEPQALALLEKLSPRDLLRLPQRNQLQAVHSELVARKGDCARAVEMTLALERQRPDESLRERALWTRATCQLRLEESSAGAESLRDYLRRYPEGKFAQDAKRLLEAVE